MPRRNVTQELEVDDDSSLHSDASTISIICPLCCEVDISSSSTARVTLSICNHSSCQSCLARWMEREESSGQDKPPTCPFCRIVIDRKDIISVLGRPFKPRDTMSGNRQMGDVDEFTRQWIYQYTVPCSGCGSRIEKESGCDLIECLCGYRFCYNCGRAGGHCNCNPNHVFLNNCDYIADEPIRDCRGNDMKSTILRRKIRYERHKQQGEKDVEVETRWYYTPRNAERCTSNGCWIFTPKSNEGSATMLTQQCGFELMNDQRQSRILWNESNDICTAWLFLRKGADMRALEQMFTVKDILQCRRTHERKLRTWSLRACEFERQLSLATLFLPKQVQLRILQNMSGAVRKHMQRSKATTYLHPLYFTRKRDELENQCLQCNLYVFP